MEMDPLGEALFGLQADDHDFDEMALITDIPLNTPISTANTSHSAHTPPARAHVSALAQQWERENEMAKQAGKPQRAVCAMIYSVSS
jgi:hypothetical protein